MCGLVTSASEVKPMPRKGVEEPRTLLKAAGATRVESRPGDCRSCRHLEAGLPGRHDAGLVCKDSETNVPERKGGLLDSWRPTKCSESTSPFTKNIPRLASHG